jgi:hypothetical protein
VGIPRATVSKRLKQLAKAHAIVVTGKTAGRLVSLSHAAAKEAP